MCSDGVRPTAADLIVGGVCQFGSQPNSICGWHKFTAAGVENQRKPHSLSTVCFSLFVSVILSYFVCYFLARSV